MQTTLPFTPDKSLETPPSRTKKSEPVATIPVSRSMPTASKKRQRSLSVNLAFDAASPVKCKAPKKITPTKIDPPADIVSPVQERSPLTPRQASVKDAAISAADRAIDTFHKEQKEYRKQRRSSFSHYVSKNSPNLVDFLDEEGVRDHFHFQVGAAEAQGRRNYMEDRFSIEADLFEDQSCSLIMLFDGHNGAKAAEMGTELFPQYLRQSSMLASIAKKALSTPLSSLDILRIRKVIKQTFQEVDDHILDDTMSKDTKDGTTALIGLVIGTKMFVANVGDTRAVHVDSNGNVSRVSIDHKPNDEKERSRIEATGGKVVYSGCWRVAHDTSPLRLAVSRALGDHQLKRLQVPTSDPPVSCAPDIKVVDLKPSDLFIFATDGVWDRLTDENAADVMRSTVGKGKKGKQRAAEAIVDAALTKKTMDNVSAIVFSFQPKASSL